MPVTIDAADTCELLDYVVSSYLRGLGTLASGLGVGPAGGNFGAVQDLANVSSYLQTMAATYLAPVSALSPSVIQIGNTMDAARIMAAQWAPFLTALQNHVNAGGITGVLSLDQFLTYYNVGAGGPWNALLNPNWSPLYIKWSGQTQGPSPCNMYFEVLQGSTYPDALAEFTITGAGAGSLTNGFAIDGTTYAGGFGYVNASGITGSGLVTVTGDSFAYASQTVQTGITWTATVGANGEVALAPGGSNPAGTHDLILSVTGITIAAGLSAGTLYIEAHRPSGRSLLPI